MDKLLKEVGLELKDLKCITSTGVGRKSIDFVHKNKTIPMCLAKGANRLLPSARTVIDVGGENSVVVRVDGRGIPEDYATHDKCASGTGSFLLSVANLLETSIEEMAEKSLRAKGRAEFTSTCAIFVEQEVISYLHRDNPLLVDDIIAGIHASIATRLAGQARSVGVEPDVVLSGGVALDRGFARILEETMGVKLHLLADPSFLAAFGAAWIALESA